MSEINELKRIVEQEQSFYDKDNNWEYYNAYNFVLEQIDLLKTGERK
tara:strand:- start:3128 stop:3268 length:141 start_codon:yes stop_codon:yes gene_type:complete